MSQPKLDDSKRQAALASRRARDKKARDYMDDSYIKRLIRKEMPELGPDFSDTPPELIAAKKIHLAFKRRLAGKMTPEMDAAYQAFADDLIRKINAKEKRKA
jgi:hypothetical protein